MTWALAHRRDDGSFIVYMQDSAGIVRPYHVTQDDPIFVAVQAAADGVDLPPEPPPVGMTFVALTGGGA